MKFGVKLVENLHFLESPTCGTAVFQEMSLSFQFYIDFLLTILSPTDQNTIMHELLSSNLILLS
jgi:hypothetical protein